MPPLPMPPLPKVPWKEVTGPSAGLVQKHFVAARQEALYRRDKALERRVADALRRCAELTHLKLSGDKWLPIYQKINLAMQAAELTINFKADSWFSTENTYETYTQGYQRSGRDANGRAQFNGDTLNNPALVRADADDRITFGGLDRGAVSPPQRGLAPGRQGMDRIKQRMGFQADRAVRTTPNPAEPKNAHTAVSSSNARFDPNTKQVFAALNYGRRPHGSSTFYGSSYLVLKPKFKVNALYFGGDTFYHQDASGQLAFHIVGAMVALAKPALLDAIVASCYTGNRLGDTADPGFLVEAHLFTEVRFTDNIESVVLDAPFGSVMHANAKKFAAKHGARLLLTNPVG